MSGLDDDEALFQDIYGDESDHEDTTKGKEPSAAVEKENKQALPNQSTPQATDNQIDSAKNLSQEPKENNSTISSGIATTNNTGALDNSSATASLLNEILSGNDGDPNQAGGLTSKAIGKQLTEKSEYFNRDQGKMFIGGLNWETDENKLRDYFSKYGEIAELTIMRDNATGRSRGFGFLTFQSSESVDKVVAEQHILDGKVIDPKRAIPREEQDKTGKIFVGGISTDVTEKEFDEFFSQFGNVIDAQLMISKETKKSRGFGFVTYDSPDAVDNVCQNKYLELRGKRMEIKRAEPRGQQQQRLGAIRGYNANTAMLLQGGNNNNYSNPYPGATSQAMSGYGYTPQMMQQYWQYWMNFQQMQGTEGQPMTQDQVQQMMAMMQQDAQKNSASNNNNNTSPSGNHGPAPSNSRPTPHIHPDRMTHMSSDAPLDLRSDRHERDRDSGRNFHSSLPSGPKGGRDGPPRDDRPDFRGGSSRGGYRGRGGPSRGGRGGRFGGGYNPY